MASDAFNDSNASITQMEVGSRPSSRETSLVLRNDGAANNLNVALERLAFANRPATEFDNFYTPKNGKFYSKSPYFKLDETRLEIRLLRVYPQKKTYAQHMIDHPEWKRPDDTIKHATRIPSANPRTNRPLYIQKRPKLPKEEKTVIACELVDTVPLSRVDGKYHALSYCAGSPNNVSKILVNGIFFNAFANLEHAIECAIYSWNSRSPGKELLLWVDQICINQDDQAERSSQVELMQDIYRRSQDSIICISTNAYDPALKLNPLLSDGTMWMRYGLLARGQSPAGSSPFGDIDLFVRDKIESNDVQALEDLSLCFESLCDFLSSPWWSRAWVYQEFIMAPRAYFVYKLDTVSWPELSLVFEEVSNLKEKTVDELASYLSKWIEVRREEQQKEKNRAEEERIRQLEEWSETNKEPILREIEQLTSRRSSLIQIRDRAYVEQSKTFHWSKSSRKLNEEYPIYVQQVEHIEQRIYSLQIRLRPNFANPRQSQLDNLHNKVAALSTAQDSVAKVQQLLPKLRSYMEPVASLVKGKTTRRRLFGLKELLDHSRRCKASDPRDRIYAFLGLADKGYGIVPKYSWENTIVHVLIHAAQRIITFEGSLDILEHVRHGREKLGHLLPSWVPDWTSNDSQLFNHEFQERTISIRRQDGNNEPFQASENKTAKPEFVRDKYNDSNFDLKVKAIFVEPLEDIDGSLYDESHVQTFLTPSGLRVHTSQVATYGDEVWVIYGASSPMVLRPDQGDRYSFISQTLICESSGKISDIMFGRMVDEEKVKVITIM